MPLPPWVNPPNFLGAIQAGTQAGISLRNSAIAEAAQQQRAQEAAAQLAFHYTQLQAQNERAAAQVQAEQERAMAANLLRAQQQNAMQQWREQQEKNNAAQVGIEQNRLSETKRHNLALESKTTESEQRQFKIDNDVAGFISSIANGESQQDALAKFPLASHDQTVRSIITQASIDARAKAAQEGKPERLSDFEKAELFSYMPALKKLREDKLKYAKKGFLGRIFAHDPTTELQATEDEIRQRFGPSAASALAPNPTVTSPTTPTATGVKRLRWDAKTRSLIPVQVGE